MHVYLRLRILYYTQMWCIKHKCGVCVCVCMCVCVCVCVCVYVLLPILVKNLSFAMQDNH